MDKIRINRYTKVMSKIYEHYCIDGKTRRYQITKKLNADIYKDTKPNRNYSFKLVG